MITVAVAGGSGKLGRTIVEVLTANPKYRTIALSRKVPQDQIHGGASVVAVDYDEVGKLHHVLESNSVHTVVSTINVSSPESGVAEHNLVEAAALSKSTKRFISSDFAVRIPESEPQITRNAPRLETIEKLRATDLEWTSISNGMIMDCFGTPHIKSYMGVYSIHIDMLNRAAAVPGTGNDLVSFSYSFDIARFVEAALGLDHWEESMQCYSDVRTYNDVVKIAEKQTGSKFNVVHDPVEILEKGQMTELPSHVPRYAYMPKPAMQLRFSLFGLYCVKGILHVPEEKSMNKMFPHIKTHTVEDIMSGWNGK